MPTLATSEENFTTFVWIPVLPNAGSNVYTVSQKLAKQTADAESPVYYRASAIEREPALHVSASLGNNVRKVAKFPLIWRMRSPRLIRPRRDHEKTTLGLGKSALTNRDPLLHVSISTCSSWNAQDFVHRWRDL